MNYNSKSNHKLEFFQVQLKTSLSVGMIDV